MAAINVLILIEHLKTGGAERAVSNIVQAMPSGKVNYHIFLYREIGSIGEDLQKKKCNIVLVKKDFLSSNRFFSVPVIKQIAQFIEAIVFCLRLSFFIRRNRIDIIHSFLFSGNLWGRLSSLLVPSVKVITTERSVAGWHRPFKHRLVNRLLKGLSDRIVAVSRNVASTISLQQNVDLKKIVVIPNGINLESFNVESEDGRFESLRNNAFKFGIIGRLERVKRHDLFINALYECLKKGLNVFGIIVGDGSEKSNLISKVRDLQIEDKIFFAGEVKNPRTFIKHMNAIVNCSDAEGMSNAILEGMVEGCPVIATKAGGNEELVSDGDNGFLIEKNNAQELALSMEKAVRSPDKIKRMGENARLKVQREFSLDVIVEQWHQLYEETLGRKAS